MRRTLEGQTILFLLLIFVGCVYVLRYGAADVLAGSLSPISLSGVINGSISKRIDTEVVHAIPVSNALDGLLAGFTYRLFDDAGPQVRAGCAGWLFLAEETAEVPGGTHNLFQHLRIARRIAADLSDRGIALVVIVVPDKARMAASQRCGTVVSPQERDRLRKWRLAATGLDAKQIDIVDGWPGRPGYWRTDTHWDRTGALFAAQRGGAAINAIRGGRGAEGATRSVSGSALPRPGDLMHLSYLQYAPRWLQPDPDMDRQVVVTWAHAGGLLDTGPPPDVVLAGSSFSTNSGFADDLGLAIGSEVVQVSEEGGGFDAAVIRLLEQRPRTLALAKVVVWEFPERSITQPLNDDERSFLEAGR